MDFLRKIVDCLLYIVYHGNDIKTILRKLYVVCEFCGEKMIQEAIAFANKAHESQLNNRNTVVDIKHPMDAADIVADICPDETLIAAAILTDILEKTEVSYEDLCDKFGVEVAGIVAAETDDLTLPWKERKRKKLHELEYASEAVKVVALGDKLAKLRTIEREYAEYGDLIWRGYSRERYDQIAWYYMGLRKALFSLSYIHYFQEFSVLVSSLFDTEIRASLVS